MPASLILVLTNARLNARFFSRESACHTSWAPDPRSIPTRPSRAFAISPNYSPHSPPTSERVSAPRKASSAKLYRFAALRSLPPVRRARFSAHPGWLRCGHGCSRILERGRCTTRGRGLALRRDRRTKHCRTIVSAPQGEWCRVGVQSQRSFIRSVWGVLCYTLPHPSEFPSDDSAISFHLHSASTLLRGQVHSMLVHPCHLSMARVSKFNLHRAMAQVPTATVVSSIPVTYSAKYALRSILLCHGSGVSISIRTSILRLIQMDFLHIFAR
jgi:hypothetical protein